MTKVRVCVGVNRQGAYYSHGSITIPDKEAEVIVRGKLRNDPEVSVSFHDLEVMTPQAPVVVEALSSEGHTFEYGDLIEGSSNYLKLNCGGKSDGYCVVTHSRPSKCEGDNCIAFCNPEDFSKVREPLDWMGMKAAGIDGNGWQPRYLKVAAKAGNWHIANGEVVLTPPPQPEPEAKTKFQFGDLVQPNYHAGMYVVCHPTMRNKTIHGVSIILPEWFSKIAEPTHYESALRLLGFGEGPSGGVVDGCGQDKHSLIAPAGQWHINSSGEVVLKPKPDVPKPKFKRGDKVTRMQNGLTQYWKVVEPVPNEDGMIVLLVEGMELRANDTWAVLVEQLGKFSCGYHYRMSYEDDCTLVPEVTAPQGLKPGDMVVDQQNLLWDVDHVAEGTETVAWLTSPALEGTRIAAVHTLKKVVFGTL